MHRVVALGRGSLCWSTPSSSDSTALHLIRTILHFNFNLVFHALHTIGPLQAFLMFAQMYIKQVTSIKPGECCKKLTFAVIFRVFLQSVWQIYQEQPFTPPPLTAPSKLPLPRPSLPPRSSTPPAPPHHSTPRHAMYNTTLSSPCPL